MIDLADYLIDKTNSNIIDEVNNSPAVLFKNTSTNQKFGDVYIFKKFGIDKSNSIKFSSDITTHYMEDNTARQDHWAIKPITYTMSGLIGELVYTPPKQWANFVQNNIINRISPLGVLLPTFDSYTQSAINTVQAIENSYNRYRQIITQTLNNFTGAGVNISNQQRVIKWLESLRDNRQLVNIWTPWGEYNDLAIIDTNGNQNNTKYQTDLEIQFMQWRNVSTATRKATKQEQSEFSKCQSAEVEQLGTASTSKKSTFKDRYDKGENLIQGLN